ncbi:hypothetical protein B0H13DRAFT_2283038 [Mycena leptocephala]|nr:hypothetical protein B0H13DRAFT_2283038 [Mycena leptocephala]
MPLFTSASGFQITGGTFIDNAGDINIHTAPLMPGPNLGVLEFAMEGTSRELLGAERTARQIGAARVRPYDASSRPQILSREQSSSVLVADGESWSNSGPSFSNPTQFPFSQQEPEFSSFESHETIHNSLNPVFEQPFSSFAPISATLEVYNNTSPSDNHLFGSTLAAFGPDPFSSTYTGSEQTENGFGPSLHPPSRKVDAFMSYPSNNLGLLTDQFGEPADVRSNTSSAAVINHFPWDNPTHQPKTISGGTFIGGNVNYIHPTVILPSFSDISIAQAAQQTNNCPPPSRIFQGRQSIRDEMNRFFTQEIQMQHIYVLYGLGGAGKTQIGLKFISDSSYFTDKFFLDASSAVAIETGLKNIAAMKNVGSSSQDALKWLANTPQNWLLFYDNADDPKINLNQFLPRCNHGNIIITSRNPELCVYAGAHSAVSDMDETDAVALLLRSAAHVNLPVNEKIATEIVKAGAFISQSGALNSYLDIYTKNRAQLLSEKSAQSHDDYVWTVYTTWQMSFDQLSQPAAMFLQLCSFLHRDGIAEDIFSRAAAYRFGQVIPSREALQMPLEFLAQFLEPTGEWDTLRFLKVTNEIKSYSLMSFDPERKAFSIHPLVVVDFGMQYGMVYYYAGWHEAAMELELAVLERQKQVLGTEHLDTLCTMDALALIYCNLREFHKAEQLEVVVVEKQKQVLGDDHTHTLRTMGNLASTYANLREFHKAEELQVVVLEKRKQVLGDDHPDTLHAMGNLASTYHDLGKFHKAEELGIVVLGKRKRVLGDDHPDTLRAMGNLASTYANLREFHKAEELQVAVLEKQKQVLGDDHPDTLRTMGNLASTYANLREFHKAEELEVVVLEKRKQVLGDDHPDTLHAMGNLGSTYHNLREFHKAEELGIVALEKRKQVLGHNHPECLHAMRNLAQTYHCLDKLPEAEELEKLVHNHEEAL